MITKVFDDKNVSQRMFKYVFFYPRTVDAKKYPALQKF